MKPTALQQKESVVEYKSKQLTNKSSSHSLILSAAGLVFCLAISLLTDNQFIDDQAMYLHSEVSSQNYVSTFYGKKYEEKDAADDEHWLM